MKTRTFNIAAVVLLALIVGIAFNAFSAANGTTYNARTYIMERDAPTTFLCYYGMTATTTAADCVGTHYTQAMFIGDVNDSPCMWRMVAYNSATGTEDIDVFVEYSFNLADWFLGSVSSGKIKDALSTTQAADTLNILVGVEDGMYNVAPWMRLKCVGQTGNPIGTYVSYWLSFRKPVGLPRKVGAVTNKI